MTDFTKYYDAIDADNDFTVELTRVYGANACNARYYYSHDDAAVNAAKSTKLRAGDLWLAEMKANR